MKIGRGRPVLLVCAALLAAPVGAGDGPKPLTSEQWREDLRYFAAAFPKAHRDAFHAVPRAEWEAAVQRLDERLPTLPRHRIIVEISKLVALIGDGHTCFHSFYEPAVGFRRYPVRFYEFSDGLYIQAAAPRAAAVVGGRVLTLGNASAEAAMRAAATVDGRDNPMWSKLTAPWRLETAEVVDALGLTDDIENTPLTVEKDGERITIVLTPEDVPESERATSLLPEGWVDAEGDAAMLWRRNLADPFWDTYLPDRRALYVQLNAIENGKDRTLEQYFDGVFAYVATHDVDRLLLDLRNNGGGNNYLPAPIVKGIMRSPKLNARGRVWVLIGRHTFSAAQNTVDWLKKWTDAIFVGEPTGSSPNQFGDAVPVTLPNSGISPYAATVWWQDVDERSDDRWLSPDIAVEMSGADYRRGYDPVLETALTARPEPSLAERLRTAVASAGAGSDRVREIAAAYRADPRNRYAGYETDLNVLGYELMRQRKLDVAVAVLEINTSSFPESWNAWDSLAEAWMTRGDRARAIADYEKSLELNPDNKNATAMLEKLRGPWGSAPGP